MNLAVDLEGEISGLWVTADAQVLMRRRVSLVQAAVAPVVIGLSVRRPPLHRGVPVVCATQPVFDTK